MTRTPSTRSTAIRAALCAAVLAALLGASAIALAAPAPATPTITTSPPNPSASTAASFVFNSEAGSTFECRRDAAAYATCTSPTPYTGLSLASHTFRVRASKGGKTSGEAVYTWSVAAPAAPTIATKPANPTNATSATFTFTTNATNATFQCMLDAGSFAACASGLSYTGLTPGWHTFQVRAAGATGSSTGTSAAATYMWLVDTTPPPNPSVDSGPPALTNSTSASLTFSDSEADVAFLCRLDGATFAVCTSPRSYSGLGPGGHTFQLQAKDAGGNESGVTSRSWIVDTAPPPAPVITAKPADPASSAISTFEFTDAESPVTFQCSVENGAFGTCTSPFTFTVIVDTSNNGQHQFAVRAVDGAGNVSGAASYKWKVDPAVEFTITSNVTGLYPGVWVPIPVRITNPHNFTILVESLTATVASAPVACPASSFEFLPSSASHASPISVPANASAFLVPAAKQPQVRLKNLASNQDTCKGMSISLTYSGTATK